MNGAVQFLAHFVAKHSPHQSKCRLQFPESVAVGHEKLLSGDLLGYPSVDYGEAYFIFQIVKQPDVVIAYKPVYLHSRVGKRGQCSEKSYVTARHDSLVLIPIVENVTEHV